MTTHDVNILWEMLLECSNLRGFARSLSSNDSTLLGGSNEISRLSPRFQLAHTWTIHGNHLANGSSFDVVDDIVTCSSNEMAIREYLDQLILCNFSALVEERLWTKAITSPENSSFSASYFSSLSQAFTLGATR